ncbi:hypothetical protein EVAR_13497_1 [Eumeta japonica]|uniref:Mariner Mos1 transposase n=1 Tax=Eumeta variegata TaxID=151549 RepID=A0A4C1UZD7_EUMVA|nr:hypothetical protein EVAR_13497_1 [Eumeta japonica]
MSHGTHFIGADAGRDIIQAPTAKAPNGSVTKTAGDEADPPLVRTWYLGTGYFCLYCKLHTLTWHLGTGHRNNQVGGGVVDVYAHFQTVFCEKGSFFARRRTSSALEFNARSSMHLSYNFDVKDESRSSRPDTDKVDTILEKVEQDRYIRSYDIAKELRFDRETAY